jgi:hypothetical protein
MTVIGYEVTMCLWVECSDTQHILLSPQEYTFDIQPPMWSRDDDVSLEMSLDHQAKMKFLVELRKRAKDDTTIERFTRYNQFLIRGMIKRWLSPADSNGQRREKVFDNDKLHSA